MERLLKIIDLISEWTGKFCAFLVVLLSFIVGCEVIARYFFDRPTLWASETSAMVFGAYVVLGGAYTLSIKGHVKMDIVYQQLSFRKKAFTDIITFCFFALFCVVLVWKGWDRAWHALVNMERSGSLWNPLIFPIKMVLPIGAFLLLLQGIAKFIRDMATLFGRRSEHER